MEPSLDELRAQEAEAFEALSQAFIKHSMARNNVQRRLAEIREGHPTLFDS